MSSQMDDDGTMDGLYKDMVSRLAKPGREICSGLSHNTAHLLHMAVGIAGEAGELLDAIKKCAIYGKELDVANVIEELGDLEFYLEGLRQGILADRDDVLRKNYEKLSVRYGGGRYSDRDAIERADKAE